MEALTQLALFSAKAIIIGLLILLVLVGFVAIIAKNKQRTKGKLTIKNLNKKYAETNELILAETLSKKEFKKTLKAKAAKEKAKEKSGKRHKNIFVLNFQ